jgi:hypothetical protein
MAVDITWTGCDQGAHGSEAYGKPERGRSRHGDFLGVRKGLALKMWTRIF